MEKLSAQSAETGMPGFWGSVSSTVFDCELVSEQQIINPSSPTAEKGNQNPSNALNSSTNILPSADFTPQRAMTERKNWSSEKEKKTYAQVLQQRNSQSIFQEVEEINQDRQTRETPFQEVRKKRLGRQIELHRWWSNFIRTTDFNIGISREDSFPFFSGDPEQVNQAGSCTIVNDTGSVKHLYGSPIDLVSSERSSLFIREYISSHNEREASRSQYCLPIDSGGF